MIHRQVLLGTGMLGRGYLVKALGTTANKACWNSSLKTSRSGFTAIARGHLSIPRELSRSISSGSFRAYSTEPPRPKVSLAQRLGRFVSFTFYSSLVMGGLGIVGLVVYYFTTEVILPSGDVQLFNKSLKLVQEHPECQAILGTDRLKAYGESHENAKMRNRPIASRRTLDAHNQEHLWMRYYVKGELAEGVVKLEMVKYDKAVQAREEGQERNLWDQITTFFSKSDFEYRYLVLDVPGHSRVYLINNDAQPTKKKAKKSLFAGFGGK
ncbi:TIM21-domain-containing protein [Nadsonia fulvescens var. elongata DSM 6958]|uniref:Mitochondrial import inner membrane translocase subunit Tim21 n=1 Tax=Nadsonia fulvescens var. elongata DSM 6958 TaxID=857566 RepID=A0A1E3PFM4_9ASCO|nr:TIM21-domain-containing protein [Nadsonia fulvescens var. elongata DSM 6958]